MQKYILCVLINWKNNKLPTKAYKYLCACKMRLFVAFQQ